MMPAGTDFTTPEGVNAAMDNLQPINFAIVFAAHALGTLVGVFIANLIALGQKLPITLLITAFFLAGGIYAVVTINAPMWFEAIDLIFAYIPMAWIGAKLASAGKSS